MATLTYNVCDRCGREFERIGWTSLVKGMKNKGKKIDVFKIHNGNQEAYSYSKREHELCSNCTKELEIFLRGERQ